MTCALTEVDAHDDAPRGGPAHLDEAGGGEDAGSADVSELAEVRLALQSTGTPLPGEGYGGTSECLADAAPPKACPGYKAGYRPHAVIGLVFGSIDPGDGTVTQ